MVLGVCRRLLASTHDAEDAFQATFLVLARRASSLRHSAQVGCWLYGVALRVARKARAAVARRQARQLPLDDTPAPARQELIGREVAAILDEEVHRLPARYRDAVVLCCFEEYSNEQAAGMLGCPVGTVKSRLSRGRCLLQQRLTRRGIAGGAGLAVVLSPAMTRAAVSSELSGSLARLVMQPPPGIVSSAAYTLAERVVSEMLRIKLALTALVLLVLGGAGLGMAAFLQKRAGPPEQAAAPQKPDKRPGDGIEDITKVPPEELPEGAIARLGSTRLRHGAYIRTAALAADGAVLASFGDDNFIRLWEVPLGRTAGDIPVAVLPRPLIKNLALASGEGLLAWSGSGRGGVRLMDSITGKQLRVLHQTDKDGAAPVMAFDPKSKTLATWANDSTLRLWDACLGKELRQWKSGEVTRLVFSPDGKTLAAGGKDGVSLYVTQPPERLDGPLPGPRKLELQDSPSALVFSADGKQIATGHPRGVLLWDSATSRRLAGIRLNEGPVIALRFSPDGKAVSAAAQNGEVSECDTTTGKVTRRFKLTVKVGLANPVNWAAFSPDGHLLYWTDGGQAVRVNHVASGEELYGGGQLPGDGVFGWSPDGKLLATRGNGQLLIWDASAGRIVRRSQEATREVHWLAFSTDGKRVVAIEHVSFATNRISVWDAATLKRLHLAEVGIAGGVNHCALSPDGKVLAVAEAVSGATGPDYYAVVLLDPETGKIVGRSEKKQREGIRYVTWSPDGKQVASLGNDALVRVIQVVGGKELHRFDPKADSGLSMTLRYSNDGKTLFAVAQSYLAGGHTAAKVLAWDSATGNLKKEYEGPHGVYSWPVLSGDARLLGWGTKEGEINVWDVATEQYRAAFRGQRGAPPWSAFSPDGKSLATGDCDGTLLIWDVARGKAP